MRSQRGTLQRGTSWRPLSGMGPGHAVTAGRWKGPTTDLPAEGPDPHQTQTSTPQPSSPGTHTGTHVRRRPGTSVRQAARRQRDTSRSQNVLKQSWKGVLPRALCVARRKSLDLAELQLSPL